MCDKYCEPIPNTVPAHHEYMDTGHWLNRYASEMNDTNWSLKVISININGMSSNLCLCLTYLANAPYDMILIRETKICNPEADRKLHYIWEIKFNSVAYTNHATDGSSGSTDMLLSAQEHSLMTNLQVTERGSGHKVIALTGIIQDRPFIMQSTYAPNENNHRVQFFPFLRWYTAPIHITGGDRTWVWDPDLDSEPYTKHHQGYRATSEMAVSYTYDGKRQ